MYSLPTFDTECSSELQRESAAEPVAFHQFAGSQQRAEGLFGLFGCRFETAFARVSDAASLLWGLDAFCHVRHSILFHFYSTRSSFVEILVSSKPQRIPKNTKRNFHRRFFKDSFFFFLNKSHDWIQSRVLHHVLFLKKCWFEWMDDLDVNSIVFVHDRVLDDLEMYEDQKPFTLSDFCAISTFLNHFVFKAIWNGYAGTSFGSFQSVHVPINLIFVWCYTFG